MNTRLSFIIPLILVASLVAGCAAAPPAVPPGDGRHGSPPVTEPAPSALRLFPDRDLLDQGIALLHQERPEPARARAVFASLVQQHPQSRWRQTAEALIGLLDASAASRESERKTQLLVEQLLAERGRALQEREQLKRAIQELQARLQAENAALTQENEQLKKDLQRLKELEIELEKRGRLLR